MKNERENFLAAFIGHNRTGKSVLALELAENWKDTHKDGIVIAFDPQGRFKNVADEFIDEHDEYWASELLTSKPFRSLIILDDYKILMDNDRTPKAFLSLVAYRNEWCIDMIMITHHPSLILTRIAYYITHYVLFYVQADDNTFSRNIIGVNSLIKMKNIINEEVRINGKGEYPKNDFPHAIYTQETGEIELVNFTK